MRKEHKTILVAAITAGSLMLSGCGGKISQDIPKHEGMVFSKDDIIYDCSEAKWVTGHPKRVAESEDGYYTVTFDIYNSYAYLYMNKNKYKDLHKGTKIKIDETEYHCVDDKDGYIFISYLDSSIDEARQNGKLIYISDQNIEDGKIRIYENDSDIDYIVEYGEKKDWYPCKIEIRRNTTIKIKKDTEIKYLDKQNKEHDSSDLDSVDGTMEDYYQNELANITEGVYDGDFIMGPTWEIALNDAGKIEDIFEYIE